MAERLTLELATPLAPEALEAAFGEPLLRPVEHRFEHDAVRKDELDDAAYVKQRHGRVTADGETTGGLDGRSRHG